MCAATEINSHPRPAQLFRRPGLVSAGADSRSASATSRLEFWKHPEMMAQFPFAHTITMTYRLANGALEVETTIENHSAEPMPVAIGYHPYFQLHDAPRDQWKVHLAAREHLALNGQLIPTGERRAGRSFADPHPLARRAARRRVQRPGARAGWARPLLGGRARAAHHRDYGPKYTVAVVFAPPGREFICFEPMAAITNAFNLAHAGAIQELQSIPPGGQWRESFWVRPSGF